MSQPQIGGIDPADDPNGFFRELLARYFRAGLVDSYIRTWVPVGIGVVLSWLNLHYAQLGLPARPSEGFVIVATGVTIAVYYFGARLVEKRFPKVGRWLIALHLTRGRPIYTAKTDGELVATGTAQTLRGRRPYPNSDTATSLTEQLVAEERTRPRNSRGF